MTAFPWFLQSFVLVVPSLEVRGELAPSLEQGAHFKFWATRLKRFCAVSVVSDSGRFVLFAPNRIAFVARPFLQLSEIQQVRSRALELLL